MSKRSGRGEGEADDALRHRSSGGDGDQGATKGSANAMQTLPLLFCCFSLRRRSLNVKSKKKSRRQSNFTKSSFFAQLANNRI